MTATQADQETTELSADDLKYVEDLVLSKIAVQLTGKAYLIESRLAPVARLHKIGGLQDLVRQLKLKSNRQLEADVIDAMTTNETSFFRDRHPFDVLAENVIPRLLEANNGGPIQIWNAASSSGQEPLSIAMILSDKFPQLVAARKVKILATDVSPAMVDRTKRAVYSRFEINRGLPADYATRFFQQQGRDWVARKELADMIDARLLNLIEPWQSVPRADVVMIRNVLIYFSPQVKRDILHRIATQVLKPGGFLFLGASESPAEMDSDYQLVTAGASRLYTTKNGA
ncbi:MAG: protein-glutamate O-methyltransferase CheR [Actinomycetota bacterium]